MRDKLEWKSPKSIRKCLIIKYCSTSNTVISRKPKELHNKNQFKRWRIKAYLIRSGNHLIVLFRSKENNKNKKKLFIFLLYKINKLYIKAKVIISEPLIQNREEESLVEYKLSKYQIMMNKAPAKIVPKLKTFNKY